MGNHSCVNLRQWHLSLVWLEWLLQLNLFLFRDAKITLRMTYNIFSDFLSTIRETQVFLMDPDWEKAQTSPATGIDRFAWAKQSRIFRKISVVKPETRRRKMTDEVWHEGGCHCGAVKFRVLERETLTVVKCKWVKTKCAHMIWQICIGYHCVRW